MKVLALPSSPHAPAPAAVTDIQNYQRCTYNHEIKGGWITSDRCYRYTHKLCATHKATSPHVPANPSERSWHRSCNVASTMAPRCSLDVNDGLMSAQRVSHVATAYHTSAALSSAKFFPPRLPLPLNWHEAAILLGSFGAGVKAGGAR